jgi:DNA polymerase
MDAERTPREELLDIVAGVKDRVKTRGAASLSTRRARAAAGAAPASAAAVSAPMSGSSAEERLRALRDGLADCRLCPLGSTRIRLAFGVGNPEARVMLIGEGPGYMEDRQGEPFVGPAGQLLDKILAAIDLSRQPVQPAWKWVYITNMVKCHPMKDPSHPDQRGNDRPPTPPEMETCSPFLAEQIRIVRPAFVLALGATAAKALLNTSQGVTVLHGKWFDFTVEGAPPMRLMPTYHPAAILRDPSLKRPVWNDMKAFRDELTRTVGAAS